MQLKAISAIIKVSICQSVLPSPYQNGPSHHLYPYADPCHDRDLLESEIVILSDGIQQSSHHHDHDYDFGSET